MNERLKSDLYTRAKSMYEVLQELSKQHLPQNWTDSKYEFEIVENKEINGKSWSRDNVDHIEIYSGVIEEYNKYFLKVMDYFRNRMFEKVYPNKDYEERSTWSYEMLYNLQGKVYFIDSKVMENKVADLLEIFVSRFIVLHELGHIFNGHCRFLESITGGKMEFIPMYYMGKGKIREELALDIRTLEYDADAFAVTQSMLHLFFLYNNFIDEVHIEGMKKDDLFYWWGFAIRSHFLLCEDSYIEKDYDKSITHIPSVGRWSDACINATENIEKLNLSDENKRQFNQKIADGAIEAEKIFNQIKYTQYNWEEQLVSNKSYIEFRNEIDKNWNKVKCKLEKYTRLPLWEDDDVAL